MAEHLLSTAVHRTMPGNYVWPESQRPRLAEVVSGAHIPVVDLACPDRAAVVAAVGDACRSHGFFQVLNHGIEAGLIAAVMAVGREFFRLPAEEKANLYSDDPAKKIRLSTSFNVRKETVHNWRDYHRLHCHRLDQFVPDQFVPDLPSNPPDFKKTFSTYSKEVRELGFRLYTDISEATYMKETLGEQEQHMAVNYYPQCPEPELTYGLPARSDPNALAILLMDPDIVGIHALNAGKWVSVDPQPAGALIVDIGDNLQLRNGFLHALVKRSGDLRVDAAALALRREPGARARPHLGDGRASGLGALDPNGVVVSVDENNAEAEPFVETLILIGRVAEQGALYYSDDGPESAMADVFLGTRSSSTYGVQVRVDESVGAKAGDPIGLQAEAAGEDDGNENGGHRGGRDNLPAVVGIVAASSAVTAIAAGAVAPAVAFAFFVILLSGLSLATMATIRGA